ncbi:MAG: TonB family protein [bacterium]
MVALSGFAGAGYPRGDAWPLAQGERRLAAFIVASLLLHLLLGLDWGFDSGRRPAQGPASITARLAPASDPLVQGVLALADVQPETSSLPAEGAPGAVPMVAPAPVPETSPALLPREPVEPTPRPADPAPQAGPERAGAADPNWYTGRDLDVLPRPLGPVDPVFPLNAQLRGVSGRVTLALSIDATGRVVDASVVRADPPGFFEESSLAAFRSAPFAPGIKGGRPVHSKVQTVVVFELGPR